MNFKTTYVLFGILIVLAGALAVVLFTGPTAPTGADTIFPSMHSKADPLKTDQVTKVVIERKKPDDATIVFEREDKGWRITEPRSLPADNSRVNNLVDALMNARVSQDQAPPPKEAGLDAPSRVVTIHGKEGRTWALNIGDVTPGKEKALAYVTTNDLKKPVAVGRTEIESALEGVNYFRSKDLLGDNTTDVRQLKVTKGKMTVELKKEKDRWVMTQPPYGTVEGAEIISKLNGLSVEHRDKESDFVKDQVEPAKLAEYHLDPAKGEVLRIEATRGEGKDAKIAAAVVGVGQEVKNEKKYYAAVDEGKTRDVVKVSAESVKPFLDLVNDPSKLRSKNLLALEPFKQPDAIDVVNSYGTLSFRKPEPAKPWELWRGQASYAVDENDVRQLIDALSKKDVITTFQDPSKRKELGLEKPDVVVKIWADSLEKPAEKKEDKKEEKKDEKKDAKKEEKKEEKKAGPPAFKKGSEKPATELRFGNKVSGMVAVERVWEGDTAIGLVPESLLDQVRKGPLAYLDKSIPRYNPSGADKDVTKVEINRGNEVVEVTRATEKDPWKFTKPASRKDQKVSASAVTNILDDLNNLRAVEVVAEKPDQKELAGTFDLAKPPVRVVVTTTKDKKDTAHTFDFGKETPRGVYFKRGDREMVYLVEARVLDAIRKDLRDPSLFSFDPEKVTALKVRGWQHVTGAVFTLSLEKKGDAWNVVEPKGFNLDAAKATGLVREVAGLHAEKFVPAGKGLTLAAGALEVEVGLPDKKTAALTVGDAEGGSFYATTDQLKNEAALIPKGTFEEVKKAPAYFAKK